MLSNSQPQAVIRPVEPQLASLEGSLKALQRCLGVQPTVRHVRDAIDGSARALRHHVSDVLRVLLWRQVSEKPTPVRRNMATQWLQKAHEESLSERMASRLGVPADARLALAGAADVAAAAASPPAGRRCALQAVWVGACWRRDTQAWSLWCCWLL